MIDTLFYRLVRLPALAAEGLVSRRGLALAFLVVALGLTLVGWLRPPLSRDLTPLQIPLGVWERPAPADIINGPRALTINHLGAWLVSLIAVGMVLVLWQPRWLGGIAGLLVAVGIAANAMAALNHPLLIEALDHEYEQRQQLARMLLATDEGTMTDPTNSRVGLRGQPVGDEQRGDPVRGWLYLLYGRWLVLWAALGVLFGSLGPVQRRLRTVAVWAVLGVTLAAAACWPRLTAEYHWVEAQRLEEQGDMAGARRSLHATMAAFPELAELERTWLLAGKLDLREGRATAHATYYRAYQAARDKAQARGVTFGQDLPWNIAGMTDPRTGQLPPASGFNLTIAAESGRAGTPGYREASAASQGPAARSYRLVRPLEPRHAAALMDDLRGTTAQVSAVRKQTARLWTDAALAAYCKSPGFTDSLPWQDRTGQVRNLVAADHCWQQVQDADPARRDIAIYRGVIGVALEQGTPAEIEAGLAPALQGLADHVLHAEVMNTVGDAYFDAGQVAEARRRYARSYDIFCLPKFINFRAQGRLGGL